MDRNFVVALAVVALFGGGALYFIHAAHERELAELRRLLQEARQQTAAMEKARDAAEQARVAAEKARKEAGEVRWTSPEPPAQRVVEPPPPQSVGADPARETREAAREAARVEALRLRVEAAKKRAEEETHGSERVEAPKLPEVRLTPKPGS